MVKRFGALGVGNLALLMIVSFQNCGQKAGFKPNAAYYSSQCRAQTKAEVASAKLPAAELQCGDFNSYACERRIFSPNAEDLSHSLRECLPGDQTCVDVDVRQYNTSGAALTATPAQLAPGGDYNREEIRCYHRLQVKGAIVFEAEGSDLAEALAGAMKACENAEGGK